MTNIASPALNLGQDMHTDNRWTLTEFGEGNHQNRTISLPRRPLKVGRTSDNDVCVADQSVSKSHALFSYEDDQLMVEDLGSRNGTFVNCHAVKKARLSTGDLVQFANALYRVGRSSPVEPPRTQESGILPWAQTLLLFDRLITERAVQPHFQPIIKMSDQEKVGYELLARSKLEGLKNPADMFNAAERLNQNATLSELMREEGMRSCQRSSVPDAHIYMNTHPCEVVNDRLLESLNTLRREFPSANMTLEIHEAAVTSPDAIATLRAVLNELDMRLSYDDFGAGQGRLLELGEVPPDVLKFDMKLIRDIHKASSTRQEMIAALVKLSCELGAVPLAEGVETQAEHETCLQMGFELGQGFLYGRPSIFL